MVRVHGRPMCSAPVAVYSADADPRHPAVAPTLMADHVADRWEYQVASPLRSALVQHRGRIDVHGPALRVGGAQLRKRETASVDEK